MRWTKADANYAGTVVDYDGRNGSHFNRRVYVARKPLTCGKCKGAISAGDDFTPTSLGHPGCRECFQVLKEAQHFEPLPITVKHGPASKE